MLIYEYNKEVSRDEKRGLRVRQDESGGQNVLEDVCSQEQTDNGGGTGCLGERSIGT